MNSSVSKHCGTLFASFVCAFVVLVAIAVTPDADAGTLACGEAVDFADAGSDDPGTPGDCTVDVSRDQARAAGRDTNDVIPCGDETPPRCQQRLSHGATGPPRA